MKMVIFIFFFSYFTLSAFSADYKVKIDSIDKGSGKQADLIFLSDGHVAFVDHESKSITKDLVTAMEGGETLEIKLNRRGRLVSVQTVSQERSELSSYPPDYSQLISYDPTILTSETASGIFRGMRKDYQNESQCYNRAHIWTYEEYQRSGLHSNKLFLFFTSRYIRNYNYFWWFHVTPMVYVGGSEKENWRTLDRRYTKGPLSLKTWTDIFMYNNAACPIVYKYSSYRQHQQSQDCYLIPTSMYFWQPRDIRRQEQTGYVRTRFFSSDIKHAYWEAF